MKQFLFFVTILLFATRTSAQTFIFGQLIGSPVLNTAGWNLNGNAYVGDTPGDVDNFSNELILTNASGSQSGGIFYAQPLNLGLCSNWTVDFDYRIWGGNAADGLAFCFLQVPPVGFVSGGGIGIPGTANGLKVVLDTWDNGCGANPELQIYNGIGYGECNAGIVKLTNTGGILNFIRGNTYKTVRIIYNNGLISLLINNTLYLTANFPINFSGYMGFTAGTGGANDQHSIRNVVIYTAQASSNAGVDVQTCPNQNVSIGVVNNPAFSYSWSPANGLSNASVSNPVVNLPNNTNQPITQIYTVSTTLANNPGVCPTTDQVLVTVNPSFITNITDTICDGSTYFFNGNPISSSGNYVDSLSSVSGCDSVITLDIVFSTNPIVTSPDLQICLGDSALLIPSGANTYIWTPTVNPVDNLGQMWVDPIITSTYVVQGNNLDGCFDLDTVNVIVNPTPPAQLVADDNTICPNTVVQLNASGAATYQWSGIDLTAFTGASQSITAVTSGLYSITGTSVFGCVSSDSLFVTVYQEPSLTATPILSEICAGELVTFQVAGADFYQWSNGQSSSTYTYQPLTSESITIIGTNTFGCADTTQVGVIVHPNPLALLDALSLNLLSDSPFATFYNNSINAFSSAWYFGDGTSSNDNSSEVTHVYPYEDGNYTIILSVSSDFGCLDSTEISIQISGDPIYYVPNTFTPDGDEHNNVFLPIFTTGFDPASYHLVLYNRWGECVFESYSTDKGWDGYYGGIKVEQGSYSYLIQFFDKKANKIIQLNGHVNVIY
ncbi:MAG: gliding motility-associated C-terminal domain-containing protein [Crocinitomicaceae bacterium]|nr:gliding motility-associated C-terminal domain-containing protein [Crocinitomicaceae bacterium]